MRLVIIPVLLASLFACIEDVGKDKVAAKVADVPAEAPAAEPPAAEEGAEAAAAEATPAGEKWTVDPAASAIRALGAKITAKHPIDFPTFSGKLMVDGETVTMVAFEVTMDSLVADHPKLTAHLKDGDFFDVANHPTATFTSTEVKAGSAVEGMTHTITGDLTVRGTTKRVEFPAKVAMADGRVEADTEFVINRQDFKITYAGKPDDLIQDNVVMTIKLVASKG
jgi:polyisoprenoid-binding protein YceI